MDVDNIEPGVDFVDVLNEKVGGCAVLLALIGPNWSKMTDAEGKERLQDEHDFVRIEIEAALRRNVRVIPVLVGDARMPRAVDLPDSMKSLARRQAIEVSHSLFNRDAEALVRAIRNAIASRKGADAS